MLTPEATPKFVKFDNYIRFFGDQDAISSLMGSLFYFLSTILLEMFAALALAAIFTNTRLKNKRPGADADLHDEHHSSDIDFFIFQGLWITYAD